QRELVNGSRAVGAAVGSDAIQVAIAAFKERGPRRGAYKGLARKIIRLCQGPRRTHAVYVPRTVLQIRNPVVVAITGVDGVVRQTFSGWKRIDGRYGALQVTFGQIKDPRRRRRGCKQRAVRQVLDRHGVSRVLGFIRVCFSEVHSLLVKKQTNGLRTPL